MSTLHELLPGSRFYPGILFSVIIHVPNEWEGLEKTLESVLTQSVTNFDEYEILLVDDASTDEARKALHTAVEGKPAIRILRNDAPIGEGASRNKGMREAKGKYVTFVSIEDVLRIDALEEFLHAMRWKNAGADMICGHFLQISPGGAFRKLHPRYAETHLTNLVANDAMLTTGGIAYKTDFLRKNSIEFSEGVSCNYLYFNLKTTLQAKSILYRGRILYYSYAEQAKAHLAAYDVRLRDALDELERATELLRAADVLSEHFSAWKKLVSRVLQSALQEAGDRDDLASLKDLLAGEISRRIFLRKLGISPYAYESVAPLKPSFREAVAREGEGAVILVGNSEMHLAALFPFAAELNKLGINSLVIDACKTTEGKNRTFDYKKNEHFADVKRVVYPETAKREDIIAFAAQAYVFGQGYDYFWETMQHLRQFHIPVMVLHEGTAPKEGCSPASLHYRCCNYRSNDLLLLPGRETERFYPPPVQTRVVGASKVYSLWKEPLSPFPDSPTAIINYPERALSFVPTLDAACLEANIEFIHSPHPGLLAEKPSCTTLDLLRRASMYITTSSNSLPESLALGRPVICYDPIERLSLNFRNFGDAFTVACSHDELVAAIRETCDKIKQGVNFREKARDFLDRTMNVLSPVPPERLAAESIAQYLRDNDGRYIERLQRLVTNAQSLIHHYKSDA